MDDDGANNRRTVIEEGTSFKGTLTSSCPIDVRGRIEGDIETPSLSVSASGAVHGRAKVKAVRSDGELSGEFDAESVELAGRVRDNTIIRARSLEVKLAAQRGKMQVIFGDCELSIGDEPTEQVMVEEPKAAEVVAPSVEALPEPAPEPAPEAIPVPAPEAPVAAVFEMVDPPPVPTAEPAFGGVIEALAAASADAAVEPPTELMAMPLPAPAPAPAPASDGGLDAVLSEFGMQSSDSAEGRGRKKRKNKSDEDADNVTWSQPPSQPPPAE